MTLCALIEDAELLQVWLIPLVQFLELIFMALGLSGDLKIQLEKQGLLIKIICQLNCLPMDAVQSLSEVIMLT